MLNPTDTMERTVADEIAQVSMERPHVVLLGAGASRAAFPNGERAGKRLPLMADFLAIVPVGTVLSRAAVPAAGRDFESVYAELVRDSRADGIRVSLEAVVFDYFASLALSDGPTLYDHLILSLRPKDVIATFNWDPFLIQAVRRNARLGGCPRILFLHGNVLQGFCATDRVFGVRGARCSRCQQSFEPVSLLYPIGEKNYEGHPAIRSAWEEVRAAFKAAFMVTIFGYGAPQSDRGAVDLLKEAWGSWETREYEQFEIINVLDEDTLVQSWRPFIHTHHYEVYADFYQSWIARHPRRTGEAYRNQYLEAAFIDENPIPKALGFEELWSWYKPLLLAERQAARMNRGSAF